MRRISSTFNDTDTMVVTRIWLSRMRYTLAAIFIALGLAGLAADCAASGRGQALTGAPAPDFRLTDLDGRTISLSDLEGRPVLLNFWATWCPPCLREMPDMQRLQERHGDDLQIVGINSGEHADDVRSFVEDRGYSWTFLLDEEDEVGASYDVEYLPTTLLIDEDGTIVSRHEEALSGFDLTRLARQALGEETEPMTPPGDPGSFSHEMVLMAQDAGLEVLSADADVVTVEVETAATEHQLRMEWFESNVFEAALVEFRIASTSLEGLSEELRQTVLAGLLEINLHLSHGAWALDADSDELVLIDNFRGAMLDVEALRSIAAGMAEVVEAIEGEILTAASEVPATDTVAVI